MSELIEIPFSPDGMIKQVTVQGILKTNDETGRYGLRLTEKDALELFETRNGALKDLGRVEIGTGMIEKLISAFCDSPYLWQSNYAATIHELLESFYYIKNETMDLLSDDELIEAMKTLFDNQCRGSMELLQGRELEMLARNIRFGRFAREEEEDEGEDDFVDDGMWEEL